MQDNKFDIDNPFFTFMGGLADVAIVNILFILCSLPVLTMGASIAAKYETFRRMREGRMSSMAQCFFAEFRGCLKSSLPAWTVQLLTGCLLLFDLMFVPRAGDTPLWHVVGMALGCLFLLWMMIACYLFPAGVYKGRTAKAAVVQSFSLAVRNLPYTLAMLALSVIPGACFALGSFVLALATPIYLTVGFGIAAYLNVRLMEKCRGMANTPQCD